MLRTRIAPTVVAGAFATSLTAAALVERPLVGRGSTPSACWAKTVTAWGADLRGTTYAVGW